MAVYTPLSQKDITNFLSHYAVGELVSCKGIAEGIENTNYLLVMTWGGNQQRYILTLFEQRVSASDLPFFLKLTEWLADRGIVCPRPVKGKDGKAVRHVKGKPAVLIEFLEGQGSPHITPRHMELVGELAARMHLAVEGFEQTRRNSMGLETWQALFEKCRGQIDSIAPGLEQAMAEELEFLAANWPEEKSLPSGVIHADIFPDNVFFIDGKTDQPILSGIIDFYFACGDFFIYDLLICMNAWCFNTAHRFVPARAKALLASYQKLRRLSEAECHAMPVLARGAAMRFLATRTHDWLTPAAGALVNPKDPLEYLAKLRFHQGVQDWREYGLG